MGVDLTLLPVLSADNWCSFDLLDVERRRELWPLIAALGEAPVPKPVTSFRGKRADGETCFGERLENPYGDKLTWLPAGKLAELVNAEPVRDNWRNRAVWAWLNNAPPELPIVLYWH